MRWLDSKKEAPGGWRATQGRIPVTGIRSTYRVGRRVQSLFSLAVRTMQQRLSALDIIVERRARK